MEIFLGLGFILLVSFLGYYLYMENLSNEDDNEEDSKISEDKEGEILQDDIKDPEESSEANKEIKYKIIKKIMFVIHGEKCIYGLSWGGLVDDVNFIEGERFYINEEELTYNEDGKIEDAEVLDGFIDEAFISDNNDDVMWEDDYEDGKMTQYMSGSWDIGEYESLDDAIRYLKEEYIPKRLAEREKLDPERVSVPINKKKLLDGQLKEEGEGNYKEKAIEYYNKGNKQRISKDYDGAIESFSKAIELYPAFSSAYNNRGDVKVSSGDFMGAIEDCNKGIELRPDESILYFTRAEAKEGLNDM